MIGMTIARLKLSGLTISKKCPKQFHPTLFLPITHIYRKQRAPLRDSLIAVIAREAVISSTTQGLPTPSQVQLRLFLAMREGRLSNLEMAWKSVISKPRIKLNTFGICILVWFLEKKMRAWRCCRRCDLVSLEESQRLGRQTFYVILVVHGGHEVLKHMDQKGCFSQLWLCLW